MIGISKLYCGSVEASDPLRYGRESRRLPSQLLQFSKDKKPVVVWNCTQSCNLDCLHCYSQSNALKAKKELTTGQGKKLIDDLADFGCPVLLFSGGEPLMRGDIVELANYAVGRGLRAVLSTNGTLIDAKMAARLKDIGLSYVGISLDGLEDTHDRFRKRKGAFRQALAGIRACRETGLKVGLRFTVFKGNMNELPGIFDLVEREDIPRICIYHLAYSGRGKDIATDDLSHEETRTVVDKIMDRALQWHRKGIKKEVLTVDNHADGPYLFLRMLRENHPGTKDVYRLLKMNGGNSSGNGIASVSWDGTVFPDQFWREHPLGNVLEKAFSEIWTDPDNEFLARLKNKYKFVTGRCADCCFLNICGGNLRARAEAATGEIWGEDPACYLTDEEIAVAFEQ